MKFYQLYVSVKKSERGNRHGYTASDYARDAAEEINKNINGVNTWTCGDEMEESRVRGLVAREISECDEMFRDELDIIVTSCSGFDNLGDLK